MTRLAMALCIASFAAALGAAAPAPQHFPPDDVLLRAVAASVASTQSEFVRIVGVEHSTQVLRDMNRRSRTRLLESEMIFLGADAEGRAMTLRSVQRVDGRRVSEATDAVSQALALPDERRVDKLRALADASARHNLGSLRRNFNDPNLGLLLVSGPFQERFRFRAAGEETVGPVAVRRFDFEERARPTVIRDRNGASIPASGRIWASADGTVWRTEVKLDSAEALATLRVSYRQDERLGTMVPATMDEDYRYKDRGTGRFLFISGHTTYDSFRRFETSGRIVTP